MKTFEKKLKELMGNEEKYEIARAFYEKNVRKWGFGNWKRTFYKEKVIIFYFFR